MNPTQRYEHICGAEPVSGIGLEPRDVGYTVELAIRFGSHPFDCSELEDDHVSNELVMSSYSVGEELRNRTLTDRRVLGARLPQLGLLQHNDQQETFQLTHAGMQLAISELLDLATD